MHRNPAGWRNRMMWFWGDEPPQCVGVGWIRLDLSRVGGLACLISLLQAYGTCGWSFVRVCLLWGESQAVACAWAEKGSGGWAVKVRLGCWYEMGWAELGRAKLRCDRIARLSCKVCG